MPTVAQRYEEQVPIANLAPHPRNVNEGDVGAISNLIEENGFYGAVYVQESSGLIIAGKHRWLAAQANGEATVPVIYLDVDDDRALRIMLGDNQAARLGRDDQAALAELLTDLATTTPLELRGTGFDGDRLDEILADLRDRDAEAAGGEGDTREQSDSGSLLKLTDVTLGDATHTCETGDVWHLERHLLVVADVMTGHGQWQQYLADDVVFAPYPGPFIALAEKAATTTLLLVQPDTYLAAHLLDKWDAIHGAGSAVKQ